MGLVRSIDRFLKETNLPASVNLRATRLVLVFENSSEKMSVKYCR